MLRMIGRRKLLAGAAGVTAALGSANSADAAFQIQNPTSTNVPPSSLSHLASLRNYQARRSSSYDRSGGNADFFKVPAGATATLLDAEGPGMVTHMWCTISSKEEYHLKNLVLRAYWDGETNPSVEVPVGDFFGLTLGEYFLYQSALTTVSSIKAMNAYFPMPFARSARITVSNEGRLPADAFYSNIDFVRYASLPPDLGYFHAQYRQATPCPGWSHDWSKEDTRLINEKKNLNGEGNYVFFEAEGRGHFIGVTHGVVQNQEGWWGEGDEMIFFDKAASPAITGTGSEDYYNGAWDFGGINSAQPFSYLHNGAPHIVDAERIGGRYCLYRWHLEDPVTFEKAIKVTIEHGHANNRSDSFFSTAYWYQTEPHGKFPALPAAADRIPRVIAVGGPAGAKSS
jgi:Protein of unknown function (DUF2961)